MDAPPEEPAPDEPAPEEPPAPPVDWAQAATLRERAAAATVVNKVTRIANLHHLLRQPKSLAMERKREVTFAVPGPARGPCLIFWGAGRVRRKTEWRGALASGQVHEPLAGFSV
jgi:hypothetical protein